MNDEHTVQFPNSSCVTKTKRKVAGVDERGDGMYDVDFIKMEKHHALVAPGKVVGV